MDIKAFLVLTHQLLDTAGIDHALIGGLALGAHGVQRFTNDVDFLVSGDARAEIKRLFISRGYKVFFESAEVMQLTGEGQIDFLFANRDLSKSMLRTAAPIKGLGIKCASVEDIIGLKIQAYKNNPKRELRDKADIQALAEAHDDLNWETIKIYADTFGEWPVMEKIKDMVQG